MSVPAPDERLSAWLDDELDASERRAVHELLGSSPAWRAELDAVGAARDALRSLPVRDAPAGFWDRLLREGPAVPTVGQPTGVRARAHRCRLPWVAAAAAAAAAV